MYYENERGYLAKLALIVMLGAILIAGPLFMLSNELLDVREERAFERFIEFMTSVNTGLYDNNRAGFPPDIRVFSFEGCGHNERYIWGKIDGYTFRGYTTPNSSTARMQWEFTGFPNFVFESLIHAVSIGGLVVAIMCAIILLLYVLAWGVKKLFN